MWKQLTYTTLKEDPTAKRVGGWQVKDLSSTMNDLQKDTLVESWARTGLEPITQLDPYPSEDERKRADRRLCQFQTEWGPGLSHTAPAGNDYTRRPNTFTHIALWEESTEEVQKDSAPRYLIQTWRSFWWQTPFGQEEVARATLGDSSGPTDGSKVTPKSVVEFLDQPGRTNALIAAIDAIAEEIGPDSSVDRSRQKDKRTVVMPVESVDEAALWIGAISFLTSPRQAQNFAWSTLERANSGNKIVELARRGFDFACVPIGDLETVRGGPREERVRVLSPSLDQPIEPSSSWGLLVHEGLIDAESYKDVIGRVDLYPEILAEDAEESLAFPLAYEIATRDEEDREADAAEEESEAAVKIRAAIEGELLRYRGTAGDNREALKKILHYFGRRYETAKEWREVLERVEEGSDVTAVQAEIRDQYLQAAANDGAWLLSQHEDSPAVTRLVDDWCNRESPQAIEDLIRRGIDSAQQYSGDQESDGILVPVRVLSGFLTDGVTVDEGQITQEIENLAKVLEENIDDGLVLDPSLHPRLQDKVVAVIKKATVDTESDESDSSLMDPPEEELECTAPSASMGTDNVSLAFPLEAEVKAELEKEGTDEAQFILEAGALLAQWLTDAKEKDKTEEALKALRAVDRSYSISRELEMLGSLFITVDDLHLLERLDSEQMERIATGAFQRLLSRDQILKLPDSYLKHTLRRKENVSLLWGILDDFKVTESGNNKIVHKGLVALRAFTEAEFSDLPKVVQKTVEIIYDRMLVSHILQECKGSSVSHSLTSQEEQRVQNALQGPAKRIFRAEEIAPTTLLLGACESLYRQGVTKPSASGNPGLGLSALRLFCDPLTSEDQITAYKKFAAKLGSDSGVQSWLTDELGLEPGQEIPAKPSSAQKSRKEDPFPPPERPKRRGFLDTLQPRKRP